MSSFTYILTLAHLFLPSVNLFLACFKGKHNIHIVLTVAYFFTILVQMTKLF
jgi:hypothetical protein